MFRHFRVDAAWPAGSSPAFKKIHPYPVVSVKDPLQSCQQFQVCARLHSNSKTTSDSIFGHFALCPKVAKHFSATVSTAISLMGSIGCYHVTLLVPLRTLATSLNSKLLMLSCDFARHGIAETADPCTTTSCHMDPPLSSGPPVNMPRYRAAACVVRVHGINNSCKVVSILISVPPASHQLHPKHAGKEHVCRPGPVNREVNAVSLPCVRLFHVLPGLKVLSPSLP